MSRSSQEVSRSQWLIVTLAIAVALWFGGRGSIFAQSDAEHETERTLRDLKIDVMAPEPNVATSEVHKAPPSGIRQISQHIRMSHVLQYKNVNHSSGAFLSRVFAAI